MRNNENFHYAGRGLTAHTLKMIAIIAMFLDHASYLFAPSNTPLEWSIHLIGRFAAPIICYLIAEGHHHTSNKKRYLMRLFIFAVISHIPYVLYFGLSPFRYTSIIWSLSMGLVALMASTNKQFSLPIKISIVLVCCLLAYNANWNYIAVLWIVNFGLFKDDYRLQMIGFTVIGMIFYVGMGLIRVGPYVTYRFGIFLPLLLFYMYNGKEGKRTPFTKWSFYVFYPLHFIVLYLLKVYVFNGFA